MNRCIPLIGWFGHDAKSASAHVEHTLPRQLGRCCSVEDDGYNCTLFNGHSGDHQCWAGIGGAKLRYAWPNISNVTSH